MQEDKQDGHIIQPAHEPGSLKPGAPNFDSSASGGWIINLDNGKVAENPLAITDPVKRDQSIMYTKKVIIWCTAFSVILLECASIYGQLICTPPRNFEPNVYFMAMIGGVWFGLSRNLIEKLVEAWENWRRGK